MAPKRKVSKKKRKRARPQPYAALQIHLTMVREPGYSVRTAPKVCSSKDCSELLTGLQAETQEVFVAVLLNARNACIGVCEVHRGSAVAVEVSPADVLKTALIAGATGLIVAHNHPSGDPEPSADDLTLTSRLQRGAELIGLALLDHIIIGEGLAYVSLADRGVL